MPVIAMVNISRFREKSCGCLLWGPCGCLLSGALTSLEDSTVVSGKPVHLDSWLYLSRSLMYLLHMWQSSVRFPHTSWCSARSTAGNGNSQNSHVTILWGQFSPLWTARISRSIVSLQSEQATGAWVFKKCSSACFLGTISPQILHFLRFRKQCA